MKICVETQNIKIIVPKIQNFQSFNHGSPWKIVASKSKNCKSPWYRICIYLGGHMYLLGGLIELLGALVF